MTQNIVLASSASESSAISLAQAGTKALEAYIAAGDIGRLDPSQRISLYKAVCDSLGLNPLTQPFEYLTLNGKVQLYAKKSCTEQLRQIHGVSVLALEQEMRGDILCMTARVRDRSGREDIATGAVNLKGLAGEALANAYMKCETKSKRRATLSICGLAMLDETEIDSIQGARSVSVEEFHRSEQVAPSPKSREDRRRDTEELLSPVPQAERPKVAETIPVASDIVTIDPDAKIATLENKKGRVWRVDQAGIDRPLAILDERIASGIEANQAFNFPSQVRIQTRDDGKTIIVELLEEK
jgi:hypothetical protein